MTDAAALTLDADGARFLPGVLDAAALAEVESVLAGLARDRAGARLHGNPALERLLAVGSPLGRVAASALGDGCFPVRAILFDKTAATNWSLGWHQDRAIVVRERRDAPGFGPWTTKQGLLHVAPPASVLAGMVTLRLHLDPVPESNAPLLIARGAHRLGRVAESEIGGIVARSDVFACLAERGDTWLYATLILHASAAAANPQRRRVLQVDYAAADLPFGLEWRGVL